MKSQVLILVLFIIGTIFFQPTYQYRLARRELTEYDLISFIVNTCSFDQNDALVQGLCDQTLQSAVMGNFPILTYYCKTIGAGMKYCKNINQYTNNHQELGAKRYADRRYARSVDEINQFHPKNVDMNTENDSNEKQIMQICIIKSGESSVHRDEFCNQTLEEIQQGLHPETKRFCKYHLRSDFCRQVWSHSPSFSRLSSISSSHFLPTHSKLPTKNQPSSDSSSAFKVSASRSIIDQ